MFGVSAGSSAIPSPPSPATEEIYGRLCVGESEDPFRPLLRVSSRVQHPVVVGLFRPTILIPVVLDRPQSDPELLAIESATRDGPRGTVGSLVRHDRQHGSDRLVLPAADVVAAFAALDRSGISGRSIRGSSLRHIFGLRRIAFVTGGVSLRAWMPITARVAIRTTGLRRDRSEVRSPLAQRVLMLLYCPFRFEAAAPRSWSWTLRIASGVHVDRGGLPVYPLAGRQCDRAKAQTRLAAGITPVSRRQLYRRAARIFSKRPGSLICHARCLADALRADGRSPCRAKRTRQACGSPAIPWAYRQTRSNRSIHPP